MAQQKLQNIDDIKIPYATEGVIRTAQLDDTVSPQNSVQLAVNMNFDRVGAIQTRPGVTEYVPSLNESIKNYGTLRNSIIEEGYEHIYQLGGTAQIENDEFRSPTAVKIDDEKVSVFWTGSTRGLAQNLHINSGLGVMEPLSSPVTFYSVSQSTEPKAIYIGKNGSNQDIVLLVWRDVDGDGFAQAFNVTADTIVAMGSPYEFDTSNGENFTLAQIDLTHVICFYTSASNEGYATVFAINLTTGAVTEPGSDTLFESVGNDSNSCIAVGDGTHFINFWSNSSTGRAQCFTVNTGSWAITAESTPLTFDLSNVQFNNAFSAATGIDFINIYYSSGFDSFFAQSFRLNISTFAITGLGVPATFSTGQSLSASQLDDNHFVAFYAASAGVGFVQLLEWNPSTFNFSTVGDPLGGYDFTSGQNIIGVHHLEDDVVMVVWGDVGTEEGKSAMFITTGDIVNGTWLYAGHGDEVSNTSGGAWTTRRNGLAEVSKPRFSQFLNYIWMVNGNQFIGGDPVATSNGGNFGTDLVPNGFPPGDFIHAGFEGRVWVANKTLGTIYYTDIVQFTPPTTYTLTYNPEVNFISNLSPQTGQSFTALYRVPRALLVFTEDTITRIYGATSVDAYPAYNVGTFSQESIIETKTGIFFHHSSGFYQFDYGSQPVEISRRIIDFVKAIPRENYDDITGVYDGFDCVEWAVGSVNVEGVTFESCVCRYTISTQVWTIYDYSGIDITAMIFYDDGINLNHLMGTSTGLTGTMDVGTTDFNAPFYYEFIDRWRSFTDMYYKDKAISGFNVYSENAAGANLSYQIQKSGTNVWVLLGTVNEENNCLFPNADTQDFDVLRLRLNGVTKGPIIVVHGIEITQLQIKGQESN